MPINLRDSFTLWYNAYLSAMQATARRAVETRIEIGRTHFGALDTPEARAIMQLLNEYSDAIESQINIEVLRLPP